jgi:hypothetical protein
MNDSRRSCRPVAAGLGAAVVLALSGCTNLDAVRSFATTSATAVENREVVADYAQAPALLGRLAPADRSAELASQAKERAKQRAKLSAVQGVLGHYFRTLADLAASNLPSANAEIGALTAAAEEAKGAVGAGAVANSMIDAAGSIAKVLTRLSLDGWRQARIAEVVREADPSVQKVVAGLSEVVLTDFSASLDQEAEAIRSYFGTAFADAKGHGEEDGCGRLARYLEAEALDGVQARRLKLRPYAEALARVGKGHAELAANGAKLDGKALVEMLRQLSKELTTLANATGTLEG